MICQNKAHFETTKRRSAYELKGIPYDPMQDIEVDSLNLVEEESSSDFITTVEDWFRNIGMKEIMLIIIVSISVFFCVIIFCVTVCCKQKVSDSESS